MSRGAGFLLTVLLACLPGCADAPVVPLEDLGPPPARPEDALRERAAAVSVVTSADDGRLTPDEVALLAIERSPRLRALRARRGIAGAELVAAGLLPNPRLAVAVGGPVQGEDGRVAAFDVDLSWEVNAIFTRASAEDAAGRALAAVDLEVAWQEWRVAHTARLRAIQATFLARRREVAERIASAWEDRLQSFDRALAAGAATALDVAAARSSRDAARLEVLELARAVARVDAELTGDLALDEDEPALSLDMTWQPQRDRPPLGAFLERLPRRRLDLLALEHGRRSHDAALQVALARRFPRLEVSVFAHRDADRITTMGGGFAVGLPIFDRNQAGVLRETEMLRQTTLEAEAGLVEARAEVTRIVRELAVVDDQTQAAARTAATTASMADLASRAARTGALSGLAAIDAQRRADEASLHALELEHAQAELRAALDAAAGP